MSFKRTQTASFIIIVIALMASLYVSGKPVNNTSVVRSFPQAKRGEEGRLFVLEPVNPTPNRLNFTYTSNSTISLYVQTVSQYEDSSKRAAPEEYLASYTGDEGSLVYEPEDRSKRHVISVYGEENYVVYEILLESEYVEVANSRLSMSFYVLQILLFAALLVQGYSLYEMNKKD